MRMIYNIKPQATAKSYISFIRAIRKNLSELVCNFAI
jgi:hypothetical protein